MTEAGLRRNTRLYGWFKIFTKRVFLPLTAIYLVEAGHVSLHGIAAIAIVAGLVALVVQIPTAYFADRHTRRMAMMIGSSILVAGTGILVFMPSLVGGMLAGILTGIGFAFISGSEQALMHDSLEQCGRGNEYVKVMGRAQSRGLIGNIILIGLVPMTYAIDKRLPFVLGMVAFLVLLTLSWLLVEPERQDKPEDVRHINAIVVAVRTFINRNTILLFFAIALVFGFYVAPVDYSNLILKDLGMAPQYIGWAFAASSLVGAVAGYAIHYLQKFSFKTFMYLDIAVCCGFLVLVGLTRSLPIAVAAVILNFGFWRVRSILYQHHLLEIFKGTRHKAMLVSLLSLGEQLFGMILPALFVTFIVRWGYYSGYALIGIGAGLCLAVLAALGFARLKPTIHGKAAGLASEHTPA